MDEMDNLVVALQIPPFQPAKGTYELEADIHIDNSHIRTVRKTIKVKQCARAASRACA